MVWKAQESSLRTGELLSVKQYEVKKTQAYPGTKKGPEGPFKMSERRGLFETCQFYSDDKLAALVVC